MVLAGCYADPQYSAQLSVSPDFTPEAQTEVFLAAQQWNDALGTEALKPTVRQCPNDGSRCISPGLLPGAIIGQTLDAYRTTIDVDKLDAYGLTYQPTMLHELGHAMDLVHHAPGTAMAADRHEQAFAPTPDDVAQWHSLH